MITCRRQRAGTTLAPTRSCVGGSTRTGSAATTSTGCAGPMGSFAPAAAATTVGGHRICAGAAPAQIRCPPTVGSAAAGANEPIGPAQPVEVVAALPVLVEPPTQLRVVARVVPDRCRRHVII